MFITLPLVLASALLVADGDSLKKKTTLPAPPAAGKSVATASRPKTPPAKQMVALAGTSVRGSASTTPSSPAQKQPLVGAAIANKLSSAARSVAPRASYLSAAIKRRATRGPALPPHIKGDPNAQPFFADSIVVEKSRRTMTLYNQGAPIRVYFIALGQNPLGDKIGRGDNRTPEGLYYIEGHNPGSKYHLSLRVSYPNAQDIAEARSRGMAAGGDIMIHGLPKGFETVGAEHRQRDWTNGCIAVTNAEIEEIWSAIPDGAAIHIKP